MALLIGTRGSQLALAQAEGVRLQIAGLLPNDDVKLEVIKTLGDRLSAKEAEESAEGEPVIGLFTRELDEALLSGKIRAAIHSLKDVPTVLPKGIHIGFFVKRADARDALITRLGQNFAALPVGFRIGTSSPRREAQIKAARPDLTVLPLRGNVDTRLRKLSEGEFDGIVIAAAGLQRLGREKEITEYLDPAIILPSPAQGILCITIRQDDNELMEKLNAIHDVSTWLCARAERSFLRTLQGGCRVPVGALAALNGQELSLEGVIAHTNGQQVLRFNMTGLAKDPEKLGSDLAELFFEEWRKRNTERLWPYELVRDMAKGKVYLVGAGPGDPGLLTLRAKELLSKADAVVYDALIHPRILDFISDKAQRIFRGHRSEKGALSQTQINQLLVKLAKAGKFTVRLKGGDPFVFGRGAEEILALTEHKIAFEVVPGVSSSIAVPAYAGIPVTHREANSSLTIVTGHENPLKESAQVNWRNLAENNGTLVFLMGLHTLKNVCEKLVDGGKDSWTPAAVIQQGTTSKQKTVVGDLGTIYDLVKKAKLVPPAILVVGDVVKLRDKTYWLNHKPLYGLRVLITRTRSQSSYLAGLMIEEGAEVIEIPTIEIKPLPLNQNGKQYIAQLDGYDWIVLASPNAVNVFMNYLDVKTRVRLNEGKTKIACIGESTAKALLLFGIKADLVPSDYKQEGLVKAFGNKKIKDQRFLFARAKEGRDLFIKFLKKKGAAVDLWPIYENKVPAGTRQKLVDLFKKQNGADVLVFASSSSADNFYSLFTGSERKKWLKTLPVAVIGPVTGQSVRQWGGKVAVMPKKYTMPELVKDLSLGLVSINRLNTDETALGQLK